VDSGIWPLPLHSTWRRFFQDCASSGWCVALLVCFLLLSVACCMLVCALARLVVLGLGVVLLEGWPPVVGVPRGLSGFDGSAGAVVRVHVADGFTYQLDCDTCV